MRLVSLSVSAVLTIGLVLTACGGGAEPAEIPPAQQPQPTPLPATQPPPPTRIPEPTPTPLSLSDLGSDFRTFVNESHQYAIRAPIEWQITPRGASHAERVEVTVPGPDQIRGPNILPPLKFTIVALDPNAGYASLDDVEADIALGDEVLSKLDLTVNGLPARRIQSRDDVYGSSLRYIIQLGDRFFLVLAYGYDQAPIEPVLETFGAPPDLAIETVAGQIEKLDSEEHMLTLTTEAGAPRQVVLFSDTDILPKGRLEGHIDAGDFVVVRGVATASGVVQATSIALQPPADASADPVLEYRRIGGFAGFDDRFVIFGDGTARLWRRGKEVGEVQLAEDQWKQVKNYVAILKPFAWQHEDNPGGPDNLATDLDFYGTGKFEAAIENQQEVVEYVQEILAALTASP